jgi:type I restriction enzyme S subunit
MEVKPGYKQTEVGVIPDDWAVKQLADISDRIMVGIASAATHAYREKGIPLLRNQNIRSGYLDVHDVLYVDPAYELAFQNKRLRAGDLLTARTGYPGTTCVVPDAYDSAQSFTTLITRPRASVIHSGYLCHFISSEYGQRFFGQTQIGGAQKNVNAGTLRQMLIPVPPLLEQRAIAAALSDVDALLAKLDQLIVKKRDLKHAAMQQLLTGQTRLPGFSGAWRSLQLGELIAHCSSGATPYRGHPEYYDGTVKWITSGELNYNVITDTIEHISVDAVEKTNLKLHPAGTFLMAITGLEAAGTRGACGIIGSPSTTNQSCMAIYPTPELKTEFLYYYYVFRGDELALKYCQGTKQQSYTAKLVRLLPIDLPPTTQEQTAIATVLSDMDADIAALENRRDKTRDLKQGMMQELLTGRIRII